MSEWEALRPAAAARILGGLEAPWWIAGGWALDLFLGEETRPHADLDVAVLRCDQRRVFEALPGWELVLARDGALEPWAGRPIPAAAHGIWARPRGAERWQLEFVLDESDGDTWRYRRDRRVTRPLASLGPAGGPLPPEVALLFAARDPGRERDWDGVAPKLDRAARSWLADAVALAHPDSPYRERL